MNVLIPIVVIAVVALIAALWFQQRNKRRAELKDRFGAEYERTVEVVGSRGAGEKDLAAREKRVEAMELKELDGPQRQKFTEAWNGSQGRFVDGPSTAIKEADALVQELMTARGYPTADFEQQAADVSVDHPAVVLNYRAAHAIASDHETVAASTEDLRQAMVHYRALFDELLEPAAVSK